jgi:hypothetical protein
VRQAVRNAIPDVVREAKQQLRSAGVPEDLRRLVEAEILAHPEIPWDVAVAKVVTGKPCS